MQRLFTGMIASAAILAAATLGGTGPASAQLAGARIATHASNPDTLATPVQWRGRRVYVGRGWGGRRWVGPGWRGGYGPGWRRWGYYGPRYRRWGYYGPGWGWWGPAAFGTGLIVGGALAAPYYYGYPATAPRYRYDAAVDYCLQRFRSYDIRSMTYLGYDGRRHPCP